MLYKGNQNNYEHTIAEHAEHEDELREQGWVDYADLPEDKPDMKYASGSSENTIDSSALVPVEQFDALAEKLADTEEQLATAQGEFIAFQNDVGVMQARIAELQGDTTPIGVTSEPESKPVDRSKLTLEQLQEELDAKGVNYLKRDNKATLISLLENGGE